MEAVAFLVFLTFVGVGLSISTVQLKRAITGESHTLNSVTESPPPLDYLLDEFHEAGIWLVGENDGGGEIVHVTREGKVVRSHRQLSPREIIEYVSECERDILWNHR